MGIAIGSGPVSSGGRAQLQRAGEAQREGELPDGAAILSGNLAHRLGNGTGMVKNEVSEVWDICQMK